MTPHKTIADDVLQACEGNRERVKMEEKINYGGPAFPVICNDVSKNQVFETGMNLRDKFADSALPEMIKQYFTYGKDHIAKACYEQADAMLQAREKKT